MRAILDSHIRIPREELGGELWQGMRAMLAIPNAEKEDARRRKQYGWWDMPDEILLYDMDDEHLIVPRGFRDPLEQGMEAMGVPLEYDDRRTSEKVHGVWPVFDRYRGFQRPAAEVIIEAQDGIAEAPAGAGKTVLVLEVVRRARQRWNLVLVNEVGIGRQWLEEARDFLGPDFGYGFIGAGEWTEGRLTVATVQTLYARREELIRDGWFAKWGLMCLDECHHQTAKTFRDIVTLFPSYYRFGVSATPDKTGDFEIAQGYLGDVVFRVTRHELRDQGILKRPTVVVVDTDFDHPYWPDHQATRSENYECMKPGCKLSGKKRHGHRNNYQQVLAALVRDPYRNHVVASRIAERQGHRQIVVSKQTNQLDAIHDAMVRVGVESPVVWLTGKVDPQDREVAKRQVMALDDCVLLTTIADEAFNAPPLDTLHMPFPTKNVGAIRQRIGRVEREWPGKGDPVAFDYRDPRVPPMANQFKIRRWEVYAPERYRVVWPEGGDE